MKDVEARLQVDTMRHTDDMRRMKDTARRIRDNAGSVPATSDTILTVSKIITDAELLFQWFQRQEQIARKALREMEGSDERKD